MHEFWTIFTAARDELDALYWLLLDRTATHELGRPPRVPLYQIRRKARAIERLMRSMAAISRIVDPDPLRVYHPGRHKNGREAPLLRAGGPNPAPPDPRGTDIQTKGPDTGPAGGDAAGPSSRDGLTGVWGPRLKGASEK